MCQMEDVIEYDKYDNEMIFRRLTQKRMGITKVNPYHYHYQKYEVYFCPTAVFGSVNVSSMTLTWDKPCVFIVYPNVPHSQIASHEDHFERFYVSLSRHTLDAFDKRIVPPILYERNVAALFKLDDKSAESLRSVFDILRRDSGEVEETEKELCFMMFMNRLIHVCPPENIQKIGAVNFYIFDVLQYITENYRRSLDCLEIARKFSVSRSKLERNFRATFGISVHEFIDHCRMSEAMRLLVASDFVSVKKVAYACGFENDTYFYLFFKKWAGIAPLAYRKKKLEYKTKHYSEREEEKK